MRVAPTGPFNNRFIANESINHGSIATKERLGANSSTAFNPPITAADVIAASPRAALPTNIMMGGAEANAPNARVFLANLSGAPIDPAAQNYDIMAGRFPRAPRVGTSGLLAASIASAVIDHGNIGTLAVVEASSGAIAETPQQLQPAVGDVVVASPRAALPAGLALSHARPDGANGVNIGLANLSGGGIDPAALTWDLAIFRAARDMRIARSGKRGAVFSGAVDIGSIAAAETGETAVTVPGARVGQVALAVIVGLPTGTVYSHARVSGNDTVQLGVANMTGAPINPGSLITGIVTLPRFGADI